MSAGLRSWPRRRWLAAAVAFVVLAFVFAVAGGHGLPGAWAPWWTWPWLAVTSALGSLVLASYLAVPGTGKMIDIGCSPCAAVAGLALGGALMAHASAPASPFLAGVATLLTVFAVRQRLTDASACPAPGSPDRAGAAEAPPPPPPAPGAPAGAGEPRDSAAAIGQPPG